MTDPNIPGRGEPDDNRHRPHPFPPGAAGTRPAYDVAGAAPGGADLIHHSDRGSQYVSIRYTDRLADIGASASVGSVADSYDNAMAEALNGTFKAELIEMQGPWRDVDQVERAIFQWITWYNEERLHSALDYVPPAEYEEAFWQSQKQTPQSA